MQLQQTPGSLDLPARLIECPLEQAQRLARLPGYHEVLLCCRFPGARRTRGVSWPSIEEVAKLLERARLVARVLRRAHTPLENPARRLEILAHFGKPLDRGERRFVQVMLFQEGTAKRERLFVSAALCKRFSHPHVRG